MSRRALWALAPGLLLAVSSGACGNSRGEQGTPPPLEDANAFPATRIEPVTTPRARKLGYVGVISARQSLDVSAKIDGELSVVNVRLGDKVTKGDVLAVVDDRPLRNALSLARAKRRSAQAAINLARVDVKQTKAKSDIETKAFNAGTSSRKLMLDARFAHKRAIATRDRAQADALQYSATVSQLVRQLEEAKIKAPFSGTVSLRHLDRGATVTRGTRVVRLISAGDLWVRFAVPSDDAGRLVDGGAVDVSVEALGVVLPATIRQIAPELDPTTQMIITEAQLQIPAGLKGRVQAGFVARVKLAARAGAAEIPRDAGAAPTDAPTRRQIDAHP